MIIKLKTEWKKSFLQTHWFVYFLFQINFMMIIIIIKCSVSLCIFVIKCQFPLNLVSFYLFIF